MMRRMLFSSRASRLRGSYDLGSRSVAERARRRTASEINEGDWNIRGIASVLPLMLVAVVVDIGLGGSSNGVAGESVSPRITLRTIRGGSRKKQTSSPVQFISKSTEKTLRGITHH